MVGLDKTLGFRQRIDDVPMFIGAPSFEQVREDLLNGGPDPDYLDQFPELITNRTGHKVNSEYPNQAGAFAQYQRGSLFGDYFERLAGGELTCPHFMYQPL